MSEHRHLKEQVLIGTAAAVSLAYIAKRLWGKRSEPSLPYPPGPPGHWLFGNIFNGTPDLKNGETSDQNLLNLAKEYGLIFSLNFPFIIGRFIVVGDPVLAKRVLVTKNYPKASTYKLLNGILGDHSMVSIPGGKEWADKRKAFNPGFAPAFLKDMVGVMNTKLERFVACIEGDRAAGRPTNMLERAQTFTADVIVAIAFGEDWGGTEPHPARLWLTDIAILTAPMIFEPIRRVVDYPRMRKIREYERKIDGEMMAVLERRLAAGSTKGAVDICSLAIEQMKAESKRDELSHEDKVSVSHQLKTFFFGTWSAASLSHSSMQLTHSLLVTAGHDTTATTIAWAIWELSRHPEVLAKVRAELKEHGVWTDLSVPPTYEQLQACTFLEVVIKETLRLYPPATGFARYNADPNETYNGYRIGNAFVMVHAFIVHRHPDLWKKPDEFIPMRWLDGSEENLNDKFLAFSRGPRDCIGKYFAMLEAKLAISALVSRYNLKCDDENEILANQLTNIPKNGAKMHFLARA